MLDPSRHLVPSGPFPVAVRPFVLDFWPAMRYNSEVKFEVDLLPDDPAAREQLLAVRSLRARGAKRREIAGALGLTPRRVNHLESFWGVDHARVTLTPGACWLVRRVWALGQHQTTQALAAALEMPERQVVDVLTEARGTHAAGWGDECRPPPVGRRSRARGAGADDLAQPRPELKGRAPTRVGPDVFRKAPDDAG